MKNRLPLSAKSVSKQISRCCTSFQPVKILTKQGRGRLGCSQSVTKHKAIKILKYLFAKMLSQVGHKKLQSGFLLAQIRWLPLKWLILRQNET